MSFVSGTVSFSRFRVVGGSPKRLDDDLLDKLREHAIGKQRIQRSDQVETGWTGGRHILDKEFDGDKNIILDCLYFGFRIDSSNPPPDLLRAYVEMEFEALRKAHEDGGGNGNGNGRAFGRMRKEARDAAKRRIEQEIKDGHYRRMRQFPILWDTRHDMLYIGATQPAILERLHPLFKETFDKTLEPLTAGTLSAATAQRKGLTRTLETSKPSKFVDHPSANGHGLVYWTSHDPSSHDYLGNEFLLWLWRRLAEESDTLALDDETSAAVVLVKQLALECPYAESGKEVITSDSPTSLPESRRAIQAGKLPRKAGMLISRHGEQYELTLQAETFNIGSASLPKPEEEEKGHPTSGGDHGSDGNGNGNGNNHRNGNGRARFEERVEQIRHLSQTVDLVYGAFLQHRLSLEWPAELNKITAWLRKG